MEKLICIKNRTTGEVIRLPKSDANEVINECEKNENGLPIWHTTSKGSYKHYLNEQVEKNNAYGKYGHNSSTKIKGGTKGVNDNKNNRKATKGRKFFYQKMHVRKTVPNKKKAHILLPIYKLFTKNVGFTLHKSEVFESKPDGILGTTTKSKQGKAINKEFVQTISENEPVKAKERTIKHRFK